MEELKGNVRSHLLYPPFLISTLKFGNYDQSHCDLPEFVNRVSGRTEQLNPGLPLSNYVYHSAS